MQSKKTKDKQDLKSRFNISIKQKLFFFLGLVLFIILSIIFMGYHSYSTIQNTNQVKNNISKLAQTQLEARINEKQYLQFYKPSIKKQLYNKINNILQKINKLQHLSKANTTNIDFSNLSKRVLKYQKEFKKTVSIHSQVKKLFQELQKPIIDTRNAIQEFIKLMDQRIYQKQMYGETLSKDWNQFYRTGKTCYSLILRLQNLQYKYQFTGNPEIKQEFEKFVKNEVKKSFSYFMSMAETFEKQKYIEIGKTLKTAQEKFITKSQQAQELLDQENNHIESLNELGNVMLKCTNSIIYKTKQHIEKIEKLTSIQILILICAGVLLLIILAFVLISSIIRPIKNITQYTKDITEGNLDAELQGKYSGYLLTLANNTIYMIQSLKASLQQMHQAGKQLQEMMEKMTSSSDELSTQIEQSDKGANEQKQRASETASAMEEMNASNMDIAQNASSTSESARHTKRKAEEGSQMMEKSIQAINQVQEQANSLHDNMKELGKHAEGIGKIINTIRDIADQTNLLALNATIEAARAGESGKGFAVVADEVRKLAETTMTATQEVEIYISNIQSSTKNNITNTDQAQKAIKEGTKLINNSGEHLQSIVETAEETSNKVNNIATATEEQSQSTEEINKSIEEVNRIATETAESMSLSAQAVTDLANLTQEIQKLVEQLQTQ